MVDDSFHANFRRYFYLLRPPFMGFAGSLTMQRFSVTAGQGFWQYDRSGYWTRGLYLFFSASLLSSHAMDLGIPASHLVSLMTAIYARVKRMCYSPALFW